MHHSPSHLRQVLLRVAFGAAFSARSRLMTPDNENAHTHTRARIRSHSHTDGSEDREGRRELSSCREGLQSLLHGERLGADTSTASWGRKCRGRVNKRGMRDGEGEKQPGSS